MRSILRYNPSPHTTSLACLLQAGERGGARLYFKLNFNWGEGLFSFIAVFLLSTQLSVAQTFPVRVTPILQPPYTPFLSDYTDPGAEKLTLQIILNDLTVNEFRTKLRLTIEGVGITITSNPNYFPPPITLQGGVPQLVFGSDIADYFKSSNLVFQGLNPSVLEKTGGKLPEGIYRMSFEVLDYNRSTVVSNKGSATAWMILNDPPIINLPVNNAKIKPINPQNIVFQWTPRHRGSPNAAFTTDYDLKLVEIWPAGRNPYDAINTSRPILETTTSSTLFVFGPDQTPLVLGREYALQIRARDTGGKDTFKNNGYSEVIRFVYGDECPMPTGSEADNISTVKGRLRWQGSGLNSKYQVRYREKKNEANWFEEQTERSYLNLSGLRAGTVYEYQMRGECLPAGQAGNNFQSEYSGVKEFTTLFENPDAYVCSDPNTVITPDGSPPLRALFTNDSIHAGGFDVIVTNASGSNGIFTGEGLAEIPWFNSAKVRVTYQNIAVNTSYQLTAGDIKSVWDPNSKFLAKSEKTLAEGGGKGLESTLGIFEVDTLIAMPGIILNVSVHPDTGEITVDTNDGRVVIPREEGKTYAITDEGGNGYLVDKDGKVIKTTATDAQLAGARGERQYSTDPNLQIEFKKAVGPSHGLDDYQTVLSQNYQLTENGKYVSWKALATGQNEDVAATALGNGDITKAIFRLEPDSRTLAPNAQSTTPNSKTLTVTGKSAGMVDELLAYYPNPDTSKSPIVAGKLNLVSYNKVNKNLVLVSVNGTPETEITNLQTELNKIYNQGVVEWTVLQPTSIAVNGINESNLDDGGSGVLSNYTEDMKKVLRAYTKDNALASNTYYLFLVKNSTSKNKLGYMPRKKQAGFIFVDAHSNSDIIKSIAHELGHGAFRLKHTFSEYPALSQGITQNLMDYPAQSRLDKWQWDYMHNPEAVLGLFEDDDEGALSLPCLGIFDDCDDVLAMLKAIRYHVTENQYNLNNLPVFKPDVAKKRKVEYIGQYLALADMEFEKIVIRNEVKKDKNINPKKYYDYVEVQNGIHTIGFSFKVDEGSYFRVLVTNEKDSVVTNQKAEKLRKYLFGEIEPIKEVKIKKYVTVVKDKITSAAEKAVDYGDDFVGNSTWAACNICTRAAIYISTGEGDDLLFPKEGSRIGDSQSVYLKGEINNPGQANNIYDDLKDKLVAKFEYIPDMVNEDYPDFEQLQDDVNGGQIIIGTYRNTSGGSGHVVMIVPGLSEEHSTSPNDHKYNQNGAKIKFPKILECGSNHRESVTPVYDNISISKLKTMRWYKLAIR